MTGSTGQRHGADAVVVTQRAHAELIGRILSAAERRIHARLAACSSATSVCLMPTPDSSRHWTDVTFTGSLHPFISIISSHTPYQQCTKLQYHRDKDDLILGRWFFQPASPLYLLTTNQIFSLLYIRTITVIDCDTCTCLLCDLLHKVTMTPFGIAL